MASQPTHHRIRALVIFSVLAIISAILPLAAQTANPPKDNDSDKDLIRLTVKNELESNDGHTRFMYVNRKNTGHGFETRLVVEAQRATADILVAVDDQPLTADQRRKEEARLDHLLNNPGDLRKREKSEKEDSEHTTRIMKALPYAFIYQRDGAGVGREGLGQTGDELVRLQFRPNPDYHPPTRVEQVLAGMQGYILIDTSQHRIAKIDGTLIKEVAFGWGILGHLNKGGHFIVEQGDIGQGAWQITRMTLAFTGRAALVKSINITSDEVFTDFRPASPDLTFAQGVELLRREQSKPAENKSSAVQR